MQVRVVRVKVFTATIGPPATPPDGTSLEEKINAFLGDGEERTFLAVQYQHDGTNYTALLTYTE